MSNNNTLLKTLESDATEAAWRTAGNQFVKLAREPLVAVLSRHLGPDDESLRAKLATFLETELGTAVLASLLSVGLSAVPVPGTGKEVPQRIAKELRIKAMSGAGDVVADVLMGPLRQVISLYLKDVTPTLERNLPAEIESESSASVMSGATQTEREREPAK